MKLTYLWMVAAACLAAATTALAGEVGGKSYHVLELAAGVYGFVWDDPSADPIEGNALYIINSDDVVVVDTGIMLSSAEAMVSELLKLTDKPVRYVINTHWHDDHVNGNQVYADRWPGVEFVSQARTREDILTQAIGEREQVLADMPPVLEKYRRWSETGLDDEGKELTPRRRARAKSIADLYERAIPEFKQLRPVPPNLTFDDRLVITRGERTIDIRWLGYGNTRGDAVIVLPKERIAATGDLMAWPVPFGIGSYYKDWIETLARVDSLDVDTFFFGHGPPQHDRTYLHEVQGLLRDLVTEVEAAVADSLSMEDTQKRVTLEKWKKRFSGGDEDKARAFDAVFTQPAVGRAWRQARGEPDRVEGVE